MLKISKKDKFFTWTLKTFSPPIDSPSPRLQDQKDREDLLAKESLEVDHRVKGEDLVNEEDSTKGAAPLAATSTIVVVEALNIDVFDLNDGR